MELLREELFWYHYLEIFPFLEEKENVVLSSVFNEAFFLSAKMLVEKNKDIERKGWIVLGSTSWVKGANEAEQWCKDNKKEYNEKGLLKIACV